MKRSISLPESLYAKMLTRMKELGYRSESAYLQHLVREDSIRSGPLIRHQEDHRAQTNYRAEGLEALRAAETASPAAPKKPPAKKSSSTPPSSA
jgi:Arc/MetJ-type ribon-helix-helix transcriptional regulator